MSKILICDRLLKGQPNADWKEGWELYYAFNELDIPCDIAGPGAPISEIDIPKIQKDYSFILVTENYPAPDVWRWWNWKEITTPKMQWAIDTHSRTDFRDWIINGKFNYMGLNNKCDIDKFADVTNAFYFPYGISEKHYDVKLANTKIRDLVFIGAQTQERIQYCTKYNIEMLTAKGPDYVRTMQESKIVFNKAISYDLNAKMLEIIGAGSFMLSNYNEALDKFVKFPLIQTMFYRDDYELEYKIDYYLKNEEEREEIAAKTRKFLFENHSYKNRAKVLYEKLISKI